MSIDFRDVSVVLQGGLGVGYNVGYAARYIRESFPGSPIILATQESEAKSFTGHGDFDQVVLTPDPGALPPVKFGGAAHNLNRQIASSSAGLKAVRTRYALKIRTDSYLSAGNVANLWSTWADAAKGPRTKGENRILAVSFFSVDPRYDERVPYHVSDWLQFGLTEDLLKLWSCPDFDFDTATWYERHRYAPGSLPREREFRSRISSEQWLTLNYLYGDGPYPIKFHNDCRPEVIAQFEEDLVDNFIIVHPLDIGLHMPKHQYVMKSTYFNLICYDYEDWKRLMEQKRGITRDTVKGYTRWSRSPREKMLYWFVRTDPRVQWMRRIRGPLGHKLFRYFYRWD